jgi:hypothetical protein
VNALVDDQLLSDVLRGRRPPDLVGAVVYTTGYWYVRLCQAVLGRAAGGALSGPILALPDELRAQAIRAVMELPDEIGLVSLRTLAPLIGELRQVHDLNVLGMEALAAARFLDATVFLSARSPRFEAALIREGLAYRQSGVL